MYSFRYILAGLVALVALTAAGHAGAATYYVRTSGDDTESGLSSGSALRTINRAAQLAGPGDTIYVGGGTYADDAYFDGLQPTSSPTQLIADTTGANTGDSGTVTIEGRIKVSNCNYLTIDGFAFEGSTPRFLVWRGSYEGLVNNCEFDGGDEGLLVSSGSLVIDSCQIQDFSHDGIQLDGEALLTIRNSTISNCQESGVDVSKIAHLILEDTTVSSNGSDGISVGVTAGSIQEVVLAPLVVALDDLDMNGALVDSYHSGTGPYTGAPGTNNADVYANDNFDINSSSYIHGNAFHKPGESVDSSRVSGSVITQSTLISCAYIDSGNAASVNNNDSIPLTDLGEDPLSGSNSFSLDSNDGVDLSPGVYYFSSMSLSSGSELRISGLTIIYSTGSVSLSSATVTNSTPHNLQLYPINTSCSLSGSSTFKGAIYGPRSNVTLSGSSQVFGMVVGHDVTLNSGTSVHADEALFGLAALLIANGSPVPSAPSAPPSWQPISDGQITISGSNFDGNEDAIEMQDPQTLAATSTQFQNSSGWGLRLLGSCTLTDCTVANNSGGGVWLTNVAAADVQVTNLTLTDNTAYGLYVDNSQLTVAAADNCTVTGSDYAFTVVNGGTLTLDGLTIDGAAAANVLASGSNLTVRNATLSNSNHGISGSGSTLLVEDSTLSANAVGLYSDQDDAVTVRDCTLANNTVWAATIIASSNYGAVAAFEDCTVETNVGGISVVSAEDGDFTLLNTVIRDNTHTGIHLQDCTLTITDQASQNWQTLRNLHGLSAAQSTLTLTGLTVDEAASYGLNLHDTTATVSNCLVSGRDGLYVSGNSTVVVDASRFSATATGVTNWGVCRTQGNLTATNCVVHGFQNGVFLGTGDSSNQASVANCSIIGSSGYGVYNDSGSSSVINAIVAGSGGYGIFQAGGTVYHVNNLLHGFVTSFGGTPQDDSELLESPRFVDADNGDYHLAAGSPAINAGKDLSGQVASDFDGNARPSFGVYEIGAYEFTGSAGSFSVTEWQETEQ